MLNMPLNSLTERDRPSAFEGSVYYLPVIINHYIVSNLWNNSQDDGQNFDALLDKTKVNSGLRLCVDIKVFISSLISQEFRTIL